MFSAQIVVGGSDNGRPLLAVNGNEYLRLPMSGWDRYPDGEQDMQTHMTTSKFKSTLGYSSASPGAFNNRREEY